MNAPAEAHALLGKVVSGRIEIQEFLGDGAMGAVYRGRHTTLNKSVAVKVLKRTPEALSMKEAFTREAQTAAQLDHPNIVNVIDFGEDGPEGLAYIAMEFLEGRDLERILAEDGPFDGRRLATLMMQATAAMAVAHARGVVHRDIKPANIMILERVDDDGAIVEHVKVCDFGLAKMVGLNGVATRETGPSTLTAAVVGTPAYMSPEQAVGEPLDERTDIYSLGVVMYELLAGAPPFWSESYVGLLTKHVTQPPRPLCEVIDVDPALEAIVHRCLEKERGDRYATARDVRNDLRAYLEAGEEAVIEALPLEAILGTGSSTPVPVEAPPPRRPPPPLPPSLRAPFPPADDTPPESVSGTGDLDVLIAAAVEDVREEIRLKNKDSEPELDPFEAAILEELNAGTTTGSIDRRHHAAAVSERAQYMWRHYGIRFEPYEGSDTYWVTDHRRQVLGPLTYIDALKIVIHEAGAGHADDVELSADGERWISAADFVSLTGQELLLSDDVLRPPPHTRHRGLEGTFDATSAAALFGRIARERVTGRFYFERTGFDGTDRIGLHVVEGAPTFVFSNDPELQLPRLVVRKEVLGATVVPMLLHRSLAEGQPLGVLIARDTGIDLAMYRSVFMKERLAAMFMWKGLGTFAFVPGDVSGEVPFAGSVMAVLPELVYRTMSFAELAAKVHPYLPAPVQRSERFVPGVKQMSLSRAQLEIAKAFDTGRSIGEVLEGCTLVEQPLYYTMAYVLLETDLILKPIGWQATTSPY